MSKMDILAYYVSKAREIESRLDLPFEGSWDDILDLREYVETYGEMANVGVMTDAEYAFIEYGIDDFLEYDD